MRAGTLRKRLTIEAPSDNEKDAAGHPVEKWKLYAKAWGRIEEVGASETERTDQLQPVGSHTVTIRWTRGVDSTMRLVWLDRDKKERVFGIEGVTADERNREMTLSCREAK